MPATKDYLAMASRECGAIWKFQISKSKLQIYLTDLTFTFTLTFTFYRVILRQNKEFRPRGPDFGLPLKGALIDHPPSSIELRLRYRL